MIWKSMSFVITVNLQLLSVHTFGLLALTMMIFKQCWCWWKWKWHCKCTFDSMAWVISVCFGHQFIGNYQIWAIRKLRWTGIALQSSNGVEYKVKTTSLITQLVTSIDFSTRFSEKDGENKRVFSIKLIALFRSMRLPAWLSIWLIKSFIICSKRL